MDSLELWFSLECAVTKRKTANDLSRRERQIMDVLFAREEATVAEVAAELPDPPTETAVRTLLSILEEKGKVKRRKVGRRFLYKPAAARRTAARGALRRVLNVFFQNSLSDALAAHLSDPNVDLSSEELRRLRKLIADAEKKGEK